MAPSKSVRWIESIPFIRSQTMCDTVDSTRFMPSPPCFVNNKHNTFANHVSADHCRRKYRARLCYYVYALLTTLHLFLPAATNALDVLTSTEPWIDDFAVYDVNTGIGWQGNGSNITGSTPRGSNITAHGRYSYPRVLSREFKCSHVGSEAIIHYFVEWCQVENGDGVRFYFNNRLVHELSATTFKDGNIACNTNSKVQYKNFSAVLDPNGEFAIKFEAFLVWGSTDSIYIGGIFVQCALPITTVPEVSGWIDDYQFRSLATPGWYVFNAQDELQQNVSSISNGGTPLTYHGPYLAGQSSITMIRYFECSRWSQFVIITYKFLFSCAKDPDQVSLWYNDNQKSSIQATGVDEPLWSTGSVLAADCPRSGAKYAFLTPLQSVDVTENIQKHSLFKLTFLLEANANYPERLGLANIAVECIANPTSDPTPDPTTDPTKDPTADPTADPTNAPTHAPTRSPSSAPTLPPTLAPTANPTQPTMSPTNAPSDSPTAAPSNTPSQPPTVAPSLAPSIAPTDAPSFSPTTAPSSAPTYSPSNAPTLVPSLAPTNAPTYSPSNAPTLAPSLDPTNAPSLSPTPAPTNVPTFAPSIAPTDAPSNAPTLAPSLAPTNAPSLAPTNAPTVPPTPAPSNAPTYPPSNAPTNNPTPAPSNAPTQAPTQIYEATQVQLFMYYNVTGISLQDVILSEFNRKLTRAVTLGLQYGLYNENKEQYKFVHDVYVCASFTVVSYDSNADGWNKQHFDCQDPLDYGEELAKPKKERADQYQPATKAAQYLAIIKVVVSGDTDNDSRNRSQALAALLNNTNSSSTTRRRLTTIATVQDQFMDVTEQCMRSDGEYTKNCSGFIGLDKPLKTFDILTIDASFVTTIEVQPKSLVAKYIVDTLRYLIYAFVVCCLLAAFFGKVHAKKRKADNVKPWGILWFSLYTWDFYSDILFCVRLAEYCVNKEKHADIVWGLFAASTVFIFVPWFLNLLQLFRAQKKWTTDSTIQEGVRGWFVDWSIVLVCAVALSGSSFGAIELANSNLFGHDLFSMGLSKKHLKAFQGKRFFSSVLFENLPQLAVQIYFLILLQSFDEATFIALLSSGVSMVLSVVDIWSARHLSRVMKKQEKSGNSVISVQFNIDTANQSFDEIHDQKRVFIAKPNALAKAIAETLVIHSRNIEIYQLIASNQGIKVGFTAYIVDGNDTDATIAKLRNDLKKLQLLVSIYWKMKTYPNITNIRQGLRRGPSIVKLNAGDDDDAVDTEENMDSPSVASPQFDSAASLMDAEEGVVLNGQTYSVKKERAQSLSAVSSTYCRAATKKLVPHQRMDSMIRGQLKLTDPEHNLQDALNASMQLQSSRNTEVEEESVSFDAKKLMQQFLRLGKTRKYSNTVKSTSAGMSDSREWNGLRPKYSDDSIISVASNTNTNTMTNTGADLKSKYRAFEATVPVIAENEIDSDQQLPWPVNTDLNGEEEDDAAEMDDEEVHDWDKYMQNMERLIAWKKQHEDEHQDNEVATHGMPSEAWLLCVENMRMLLSMRERLKSKVQHKITVFEDEESAVQPLITSVNMEEHKAEQKETTEAAERTEEQGNEEDSDENVLSVLTQELYETLDMMEDAPQTNTNVGDAREAGRYSLDSSMLRDLDNFDEVVNDGQNAHERTGTLRSRRL